MQEKFLEDIEANSGPFIFRIMNNLMESVSWTSDVAALTQIYAAVGEPLKAQKITGKYFHPIARLTETTGHSQNKTLQTALWDVTEDFIATRIKELA